MRHNNTSGLDICCDDICGLRWGGICYLALWHYDMWLTCQNIWLLERLCCFLCKITSCSYIISVLFSWFCTVGVLCSGSILYEYTSLQAFCHYISVEWLFIWIISSVSITHTHISRTLFRWTVLDEKAKQSFVSALRSAGKTRHGGK